MKVCYAPKAHIIPSEQLTAYARIAGIDAFQPIYLASEVDALVADLKNELMEEARLSGMGSEREARLLARIAELEKALRDLIRRYVGTLENGRDRIIQLGGDCDPVEVMERGDPYLREAKKALGL